MSGTTPDGFSGGTLLRRGGQCRLARRCVMFQRNLHAVAGHQHQFEAERVPVLTRHCEEQERREADAEWIVFFTNFEVREPRVEQRVERHHVHLAPCACVLSCHACACIVSWR